MYQTTFSIDLKNKNWIEEIEKVLQIKLKKNNSIMASKTLGDRLFVSVACENEHRAAVNSILSESFGDMYATVVKYTYLEKMLNLPRLKAAHLKILLNTLVVFDRESEREFINSKIQIVDNLALDGIYLFRMAELRSRWNDISNLAMDNSAFLTKDETFFELLRFLISSINPKIFSLEISETENIYKIYADNEGAKFEYTLFGTEQLMMYLIQIAPLEIKIKGEFKDKSLERQLISIFDAKPKENKFKTFI